ncbi:hypothetical protein M758_7G000900 [Ceratodon purpureus]|nr:hypothetical protein M758_7G000900 [Ceratodon purpureus]
MQRFIGPGRMRIRKPHHRNTVNTILSVSPEDVRPATVGPLLKFGWDGDDRSNVTTSTMSSGMEGQVIKTITTTGTGTGARTEQSGLESVTTISRQSASPGVSMLQSEHVVEEPTLSTERGMKLEPDMAVHLGGSSNVDVNDVVDHVGAELEGSTLSVEQLWQTQDGEEHVTRHYVRRSNATRKGGDVPALAHVESSMTVAAQPSAVEGDGNDRIKQTCKSELRSVHVKMELLSSDIGALKRKLPLENSSEKKSEGEVNHPSTAPEGSVLHILYLQLLAAGSEGMTLKELFTSFKKQTALPSLASDWKKQVRDHLKSNSHFDEVKGHYLLCEQAVQPKRRSGSSNRSYLGANPRTTNSSRQLPFVRTTTVVPTDSTAAAAQPSALSLQKHEGVQTRRKAYERSIEAILTESAIEFQKMQQSLGNMEVTDFSDSRADYTVIKADPAGSQATQTPLPTRKRKSSSDNEELDTHSKTIRGSLQAMQARIVAQTGVQKGVPCSRKDDARRWRCPLMAMEGHTLCEHHKTLQLRKRVKKQEESKLARRSGGKETKLTETEPCLTIDKEDIVAGLGGVHAVEALMDLQGRVREGEYVEVVQPRRISLHDTVDEAEAMEEDATPNLIEEKDSEVFMNNSFETVHTATTTTTTTPTFNEASRESQISSGGEPDDVHTNVHHERAIPGSLNDEPPKGPVNDESSNVIAERLLPQVFKNAPKKRYVAAKKTVVNVDVVKEKSQERETSPLIRPPTIPPLPAMYGMRRKAIKNRSLLLL